MRVIINPSNDKIDNVKEVEIIPKNGGTKKYFSHESYKCIIVNNEEVEAILIK